MTDEEHHSQTPAFQELYRALQVAFAETRAAIGPHLQEPANEMAGVVYADNLLKFCVTVVLEQLMPNTVQTNLELAGRVASLILSPAHPDVQPALGKMIGESFAGMHAQRMAKGVRIQAQWTNTPVAPGTSTRQ